MAERPIEARSFSTTKHRGPRTMKRFVASFILTIGVAFTSGCAEAPQEAAESAEQPLVNSASANFTKMLQPYGLERLVVSETSGRVVFSNGTSVTLTTKTVQLETGPKDLLVATGSDGSHATMYTHLDWPLISTNGETHIMFHKAASVGEELAYWRSQSSASLALAGLVIDTMGSVYGLTTEEALTARLTEAGAVPGISNGSFAGGGGGGGLRPMQKAPAPGGGDVGDDEFPAPATDAELNTIEIKRDLSVAARDCLTPLVTTLLAALAVSWSCQLCARMVVATVASAAGGPVAIVTLLATGAACTICAVSMYSVISGTVDTYNGCVNGQVTDPFAGGGGGGGPVRQVHVDVASY